jgi:hypothetical protein
VTAQIDNVTGELESEPTRLENVMAHDPFVTEKLGNVTHTTYKYLTINDLASP